MKHKSSRRKKVLEFARHHWREARQAGMVKELLILSVLGLVVANTPEKRKILTMLYMQSMLGVVTKPSSRRSWNLSPYDDTEARVREIREPGHCKDASSRD